MSIFNTIWLPILTILAAASLGRLASRLWRPKVSSIWERALIDTLMGLGLLSLVVFTAGLLHLYSWTYLLAILILPVIYGGSSVARFTAAMLQNAHTRLPLPGERAGVRVNHAVTGSDAVVLTEPIPALTPNPQPLTPGRILCILLFTLLAICALIPAAAPPAMSDWDSLAYHLAVPKLYVQHGGIYNIEIMSHSNFPFLIDMLYVPAVALQILEGARLLSVFIAAMLVALVALTARRHFHPASGPSAALGIAGMPIVLFLATTAYIDLSTALYTVLAIYFLLNYLDTRERSYLIGCAVAAGFAASTKMTGLVAIPLIVGWLVLDHLITAKKVAWKPALIFTAVAFAVCSPWYIKTFIYTGNPVYPFFYGIFGGRGWSSELAEHYAYQQSLFGMGHDLGSFLMLPWNLAFSSAAFYDRPGLFVGPLFLIAVPLLFMVRGVSRKLAGLLGFFFAYLAVWFGLTHQSRYLIPGFAVLSIIVAAVAYSDERLKLTRAALWTVSTATALFGAFTLWPAITHGAPVVFGREPREEFLTRSLDIYSAQQFMNQHLPPDARVALMGDTRGYYLDRDYVWADWGHSLRFSRRHSSAGEMAAYLKSQGITHVMINYGFFAKRGPDTEPYYRAVETGVFEEIYPSNGLRNRVVVYRVN